jgi:DNA repair protein RecO (recombination protein O)
MTLHKTKGIVLRVVKYGETSVIVTMFTELFGIQSYLVNGVRTASKKGSGKANLFQPGAILDLVAYHNELHHLQRLREFRWSYLYQHVFFDVVKNSVALFMVELVTKLLKQPETNAELFYFVEDALMHLDKADHQVMANYPLFFALHLASIYGFRFSDKYTEDTPYLDLQEGQFVHEHPVHPQFLAYPYSYFTSQLLKVMQPHELAEIKLNQDTRRILLQAYQSYYVLHVQDFGAMKTLPVLQEVLG